ncbi:hypothetical protein L202_06489 [Cryptococcus amylolentus CBS 6039]|uniref:RGS domain-containing protein n=2 Tax=Cryptococcus amylolentus TaxID=104669 RepID=A0A1E3HG51_9TREE|nr:hypothetical protein L202_06489 [Cryptococcus amylolentus CBS 6039]ODN75307.1 hypothetical protein L202_06489 [Cryptococcus amylolentus CBS 6039]ODO03072.1 hypothetical protein I350_05917 [Cryptococcus amylolentus CBS 6273]
MDSQQLPSYSPPLTKPSPPPCPKAVRSTRHISSDLLSSITLDRILKEETRSPVTKNDLLRWLECRVRKAISSGDQEEAREAELGWWVVEFLSEVEMYKESFNALPAEKASLAPPPFQVISQIALTNSEIMRPPPTRRQKGAASLGQDHELNPFKTHNVGHERDKSSIESFETWSSDSSIPRKRLERSPSNATTIENTPSLEPVTLELNRPELASPRRVLPKPHNPRSPSAASASSTLGISGLSMAASYATGSGRSTAGGLARQAFTAGGLSDPSSYQREMDRDRRDTMAPQAQDPLAPPPPFEATGLGSFRNGLSQRRPTENMLSRPLSPIPSPSLSQKPLSPCPSIVSMALPAGLDPGVQPLRQRLASLTELYLLPYSSRSVVPLIPPRLLATFVSESSLTTHPETIGPTVTVLYEMFSVNPRLLPAFLNASAQNLHRNTAMGRLLVGFACCVVVIAIGICLILDPSPFNPHGPVDRVWRLTIIPLLLGGVGYGMGARASLCFWLAFFGVTEETYSPSHPPLSPSQALNLLSSAFMSHLPCGFFRKTQRKIEPVSERRTSRKLKKRNVSTLKDGNPFGPGDAAVAGFGLDMVSMSRSRSGSNPTPATHILASSGSTSYEQYSIWVLLWRLTGTAWGVKKVEDPFLRKYQRREAWKIAGQLVLALIFIGAAFFFVPYIPLSHK